MDVKECFERKVGEDLHVNPTRFQKQSRRREVCRLKKFLLGLKQSSSALFKRFSITIKQFYYHQRQAKHTLTKHAKGKFSILILYIDDIIITTHDTQEIEELKKKLRVEFEVKDLCSLR